MKGVRILRDGVAFLGTHPPESLIFNNRFYSVCNVQHSLYQVGVINVFVNV